MPWIESHTVLVRHRKTLELAKELRIRPVYAMGHLHSLWHTALEQQEDGDLSKWSDEMIADAACFMGDAPQFVRLLQKHGWLDDRILHDWLEYAGRYLESKYRTAHPQKIVEIRAKHGKTDFRPSKDRLKTDFRPSTLPNITLPKITKEKKERGAAPRPDSLDDVKKLMAEKGVVAFAEEAVKFWSFYDSKGWKVGKSPMVNWRSAVAGWVARMNGGKQTTEKCHHCGAKVTSVRAHIDRGLCLSAPKPNSEIASSVAQSVTQLTQTFKPDRRVQS